MLEPAAVLLGQFELGEVQVLDRDLARSLVYDAAVGVRHDSSLHIEDRGRYTLFMQVNRIFEFGFAAPRASHECGQAPPDRSRTSRRSPACTSRTGQNQGVPVTPARGR
ncbi:hypothetical protein GCM10009527_091100 [Actinomadura nitritigenes]